MVTLPPGFVAIKYPGYFWNLKNKKLYTMKITGILRPLSKPSPNYWNDYSDIYRVSVNGGKRTIPMSYLAKLVDIDSIISVEEV